MFNRSSIDGIFYEINIFKLGDKLCHQLLRFSIICLLQISMSFFKLINCICSLYKFVKSILFVLVKFVSYKTNVEVFMNIYLFRWYPRMISFITSFLVKTFLVYDLFILLLHSARRIIIFRYAYRLYLIH